MAAGFIGVDVFFVISGFLITGLLLRELEATGRIALGGFYARRVRRLLPLAAFTLLGTLALGWWLLAPIDRGDLFGSVRAAALYVANWRFAGQATDYFAPDLNSSATLHFWSLAIEEQFYAIWPLVLIAAGFLATRLRRSVRAASIGALTGIVVASLVASLMLTSSLGTVAFFLTPLRLWELGAGGLLALAAARGWSPGGALSTALLASSTALLLTGFIIIGPTTPFPGAAALIPVLAALGYLAAGLGRRVPILDHPLLVWVGQRSYAWYLLHWPAILFMPALAARLGWRLSAHFATALAVAGSLALAALVHRGIENPLRAAPALKRSHRRTLTLGIALTLIPITIVASARAQGADRSGVGELTMTAEQARGDEPTQGSRSCYRRITSPALGTPCVVGDPEGGKTVVMFGDSKALQWVPAIDAIGVARGWRVLFFGKSGCTVASVPLHSPRLERPYRECARWADAFRSAIARLGAVDLFVTGRSTGYATLLRSEDGSPVPEERVPQVWQDAVSEGFGPLVARAPLVLLADSPLAPEDPTTCLSLFAAAPERCMFPRAGAVGRDLMLLEAEEAALGDRLIIIDPTPLICPRDPCRVATSQGIPMYRDPSHLTATYARTLAPRLGDLIDTELAARGGVGR